MSVLNPDKKILLVDDNRLILRMIGATFRQNGFKCMAAESATDALELLQQEVPDIILSDYSMPEMDGFQFRQLLMEHPVFHNIPFIFFTSFSDSEMMMEGLNLKAVDYISKETRPDVIVSKVDNILSTVREQQRQSLAELRKGVEALQIKTVPAFPPAIPGFKIDFVHQSYQDYPGGDFIDFISVQDHTIIVLGDVMGKKWGAWFFSFVFLSYIRTAIRLCALDGNLSTGSILDKINKVICEDPALKDIFSIVSLVSIDHKTGSLVYSGAGDLPLLLYDTNEQQCTRVHSEGFLLGLFSHSEYLEHRISLKTGDKLILLTDGIIDFEDEHGKKTDFNLFQDLVTPILGAQKPFDGISARFRPEGDRSQVDDRSLIYIEKNNDDN